MTRNVVCVFLLLALMCACSVARRAPYIPPTDLQAESIKGPVKAIRHREINLSGKAQDDPKRIRDFDEYYYLEYNSAGNMILRRSYFGKDTLASNVDSYTYDTTGMNPVSSMTYYPGPGQYTFYRYRFDDHGRLARESGGPFSRTFFYGDDGYPLATVTTGKNYKDSTTYHYNATGHKIKDICSGKTIARYSYCRGSYLRRQEIRDSYVLFYDLNGNIVRKIVKASAPPKKGRSKPRALKTVTKFTYEYDERGNWIRRLQTSDGRTEQLTVREIEYYE